MKFPIRLAAYCLAAAIGHLTLAAQAAAGEAGAAVEAATPPAISTRDGQHDFDFNVGVWKTRIRRVLDPLSGSTRSIELNGTVTVRKV
jgi:hypothetical protein